MIDLKSDEELDLMRIGGEILQDTLHKVLKKAVPGVTLSYLDQLAERNIESLGGESSFKKVKNYKWTICGCVNDVVVHGIPDDYRLKDGDVLGIDCGVYYKGFHTDAAWTKIIQNEKLPARNATQSVAGGKVNNENREVEKFIKTGKQAFYKALEQVKAGNHIYDISKAIQDTVESAGFSPVRSLVGHGVGRELHEEPEIPCFVKRERKKTPVIEKGMTLAIEVIYNMGSYKVTYKGNDGWTIATVDGKISGLFESTVAVMSHGCVVLTTVESRLI